MMSRASTLLVLLALASLAYAARSPVCLASGSTIYKPLQLYPKDCPTNAANCMAAVYKYNATQFKSNGPSTLMPGNRESLVYMTQDESDNLDVVVITATTYKNNIIQTNVEVVGAAPGADTLVRDDPTEDAWTWDSANNKGSFTWKLQPTYTDGVVLGHFKLIDNYCFRVQFKPNWAGAIANIVFLSGNVSKPTRVVTKPLTNTDVFFEFCSYPQVLISKTDYTCQSKGSITATSLNGTATYSWMKNGQAFPGTTNTISNLDAGTYTVTVTKDGCSASRDVVVNSVVSPITAGTVTVDQTRTQPGKITLTANGGYPPYTVTWRNSAGTVIATNVMSVNVAAGTYSVTVTDGCSTQTITTTVNGPTPCTPGNYVKGDDCVACPAGKYSTTYDAPSCDVCPVGFRNGASGSTSCDRCPANTQGNGGSDSCVDCPANQMSSSGSGSCMDCPLGTVRATGASGCTPCPTGTYRCAATAECTACPAGTFSAMGASTCEMCGPGTSSVQGSSTCSQCPVNTYAAAGSSTCTACPSGQAVEGSSSVVACM